MCPSNRRWISLSLCLLLPVLWSCTPDASTVTSSAALPGDAIADSRDEGSRRHDFDDDDRAGGRDDESDRDQVAVCHVRGRHAEIIEVSRFALSAHLAHGDHIARYWVDQTQAESGDGVHFGRIGDAIAAARAVRVARGETESAACRITIAVRAGTYRGSTAASTDPSLERFPLLLDFPDVTLRGAFRMETDASARATGVGRTGEGSILLPTPALVSAAQFSEPIVVVNGTPGGSTGNGVMIRGFVFQSGHVGAGTDFGGLAILSLRVSGLVIARNRFDAGFSESIDLRASSGAVGRNHLGGGAGTCDVCLAGPGTYRAEGNRLLAGGIPGILIVPATGLPLPAGIAPYVQPAASTVTADIVNNEVRDHLRKPVGAGLRVGAIGVGAPNVAGTSIVTARDNLLANNTFGVLVEAAFPVANTLRRGDVTLTLHGNVIAASCQNAMLVAFSRHTTVLGLSNAPYLLNSTYAISLGGDLAWDDVWYGHPAGFANLLTVDGNEIPNGARHAYDPNRTCTP